MGGRESDRTWAAETLGVTDDPVAARTAFLRRLPGAGFVPPVAWRVAVQTLTSVPGVSEGGIATDAASFHDREAAQRGRIDDFMARFWSLNPADRRAEWRALTDGCGDYPPIVARLRALEAGLDIQTAAPGNTDKVVELSRHLQDLFVLPPADRAARRADLIVALSQPTFAWESAAWHLRDTEPALISLDPTYIERVASMSAAARRIADFRRRAPWRSGRAPRRSSSPALASWWVIFLMMIGVVRLVTGLTAPSRPVESHLRPPETPTPAATAIFPQLLLPTHQLEERLQLLDGEEDNRTLTERCFILLELERRRAAQSYLPGVARDLPGWPKLPGEKPPEGRP